MVIGSGVVGTASTSFATPPLTVARSLSDGFAGIRAVDVPLFVLGQADGCALSLQGLQRLFDDADAAPLTPVGEAQRGR